MTGKAFDLERLKRNWDRAASPPEVPLPERLLSVALAQDPYLEARRLLDRIAVLARAEFPRAEPKLKPFLAEADALLSELRASVTPLAGADAAVAKDPAKVRSALLKVLADLEDLFEVYAGIGIR